MFLIPEQFSAATKSQLEAQLKILNNFASKAVESAEKIIALNISTTRASVEKSSSAARQLLEAKDPQAFFSLGSGPQAGLDNLLAYGRQLFSIATGVQNEFIQSTQEQLKEVRSAAKPAANVVVSKSVEPANEPVAAPAAPVAPVVEAPVVVAVAPKAEVKAEAKVEAKPAAKAKPATAIKPVAAAVDQAVAKPSFPAVPAKPAAAPVAAKPAALTAVAPSKTKPPVKTSSGPAAAKPAPSKQLDMLSGSGKGKK